ncbi:MAG: single-stranded DNA-binding protein [Leucobacter sp.]
MSQQLSIIGQLATDPKLFTPEGGVQFCTFRIASTERRFNTATKEWIDGDTNWFTVNSFRSLAVHSHESFTKGDRVVVTGRLRVRHWEKEEKKGTSVEIDADGIGHDVRWGTSTFTKQNSQSEPTTDEEVQSVEALTGFAETSHPEADVLTADNFTPSAAVA